MADTYITCTVSPCQIVTTLDVPILNLDASDGAIIAGAILAIWAVGFGIRVVIQTLKSSDGLSNESE